MVISFVNKICYSQLAVIINLF